MKNLKLDKTFPINDNYSINCYWDRTRYGFRHIAKLIRLQDSAGASDYTEIARAKVCYYNRTWESFEYETVISCLLDRAKIVSKDQKSEFMSMLRRGELDRINASFGFIGAMAKAVSLLADSPKEANDRKEGVLKSALGPQGLIMPETWQSEEARTSALDGAIQMLTTKIS